MDDLADAELIERIRAGKTALYETLMRRYNQRLYRIARVILRSPEEAEDVVPEAYVRAYTHLAQFAGAAKFSTGKRRVDGGDSRQSLRKDGPQC